MDTKTFDDITRFVSTSSSRRAAIAGLSACLPMMTSAIRNVEAAIARRKRRKRPKRPGPQPTCDESCGEACITCFNRPDNAPLCGDGCQFLCVECSLHNDCVGSPQPYCIVDRTDRATGERRRWNCPEYSTGICARVLGCNEI